ncbi:hypothetical protein [Halomonas caseinilytica]|uniref:hypothetical protein n=1 Tax=Halomonas caseinilytica TaxID=438744 RepID=UPI0010BEF5D4|nr:hypothetical protein [Halomonas caseinilytica]
MMVWPRISRAHLDTGTLLLAAGLSAWLLWRPELIQGLPLGLRLPLVVLGFWALGTSFARPLVEEVGMHRLERLVNAAWSHGALWGFALVLVGRAWLL